MYYGEMLRSNAKAEEVKIFSISVFQRLLVYKR